MESTIRPNGRLVRSALVLACVFASVSLQSQVNTDKPGISWIPVASMPIGNFAGRAVVLGNEIHVVGGRETMGVNGNFHLVYNTGANMWVKKASLRIRRANFALAAVSGKLYAIGGDVFSPLVEIYDPLKDSWTPGANMPTKRQHIDCAVADGKIYVMGGLESWTKLSGKNEAYDPATDSWETKAPIPTPRHNSVVVESGGKIYVIGGGGDSKDIWNTTFAVETYDPATDTWERLPPLPVSRFQAAGTSMGGMIVIAGGAVIETDTIIASLDAYDPAAKTWRKIGELPQCMCAGYLVTTGDRLYALGGADDKLANIMQVYYAQIAPVQKK